jgi:hypothetical protein
MSLGPISRAAADFERKAPRACLVGMRILVIAFLVAGGGFIIASTFSVQVGYIVSVCGILGGLIGMAIYLKGLLFDRKDIAP